MVAHICAVLCGVRQNANQNLRLQVATHEQGENDRPFFSLRSITMTYCGHSVSHLKINVSVVDSNFTSTVTNSCVKNSILLRNQEFQSNSAVI
jgi:hypothetical protein